MNRHKHLKRLEQLRDAINKRYGKYKTYEYMRESDFPDGGVWAIWLALLKDIKECGFSTVFKIDGVRLYYYNELWKKINNKMHEPLNNYNPKDGMMFQSNKDGQYTGHGMYTGYADYLEEYNLAIQQRKKQ